MAGSALVARVEDEELRRRLRSLSGASKQALMPIGSGLAKIRRDRLRRGSGPNHIGWKALHPGYAPIKRGPGILRASGSLMQSITFAAGANEVHVGTNSIYARPHQMGAVIRPKKGKYLVFKMASGLFFATKVTIPARPYLDFDKEDEEEIQDVLELVLMRSASGGR
jgi:phage virion morphogenesis protein